jgi:hypothetical protein
MRRPKLHFICCAKEKIILQKKYAYTVLLGASTKGKKPHGKLTRKWECNVKKDLQEVERGMNRIDVT